MTTSTIVTQFAGTDGALYSVRRRPDGLFELWRDNAYAGLGYGYDDEPTPGIYADYDVAEAELLRIRPGVKRLPKAGADE